MPPRVGVDHRAYPPNEKVLALEVCTDPRLRCERVLRVRIDRAVDENGQPLAQVTRNNTRNGVQVWSGGCRGYSRNYGPARFDARYVPFRLAATKETANRLKELHGVLSMEVQTPPEAVVSMDNILKAGGKEKTSGGAQLKVLTVDRQKDGQVTLRVQLTTPLLDGNQLRRAMMIQRRMVRFRPRMPNANFAEDEEVLLLVDASGKHFTNTGTNWLGISSNVGVRHAAGHGVDLPTATGTGTAGSPHLPCPASRSHRRAIHAEERTAAVGEPRSFQDMHISFRP